MPQNELTREDDVRALEPQVLVVPPRRHQHGVAFAGTVDGLLDGGQVPGHPERARRLRQGAARPAGEDQGDEAPDDPRVPSHVLRPFGWVGRQVLAPRRLMDAPSVRACTSSIAPPAPSATLQRMLPSRCWLPLLPGLVLLAAWAEPLTAQAGREPDLSDVQAASPDGGQLDTLADSLEQAARRTHDAASLARLGFVRLRQAVQAGGRRYLDQAEAAFTAATERDRRWSLPWYGLGLTRVSLRRAGFVAKRGVLQEVGSTLADGAMRAFLRALELDPGFRPAVDSLLPLIGEDGLQVDPPEIMAVLEPVAAAERSPRLQLALLALALSDKDYERAMVAYRNYVALGGDPDTPALDRLTGDDRIDLEIFSDATADDSAPARLLLRRARLELILARTGPARRACAATSRRGATAPPPC